MMKGGSKDESNRYNECHNNEKIKIMMIMKMKKTSQNKGDGGDLTTIRKLGL
jgi:hypothetical protein